MTRDTSHVEWALTAALIIVVAAGVYTRLLVPLARLWAHLFERLP